MAVLLALPMTAGAAGKNKVYVLHVDQMQTIDPGLAQITDRAFAQAEADPDAVAVAIVLNTPGGLVSSALDMKNRILGSHLKSVAFVENSAWSAGALIGTAAEKLYMRPDSTIGAAEPRLEGSTQPADYKTMSALVGAFRATAEARGRDPNLAGAMVDKNAKVSGQRDELLVLTAKEAVDKRYADGMAADLTDALKQAGVTNPTLVDVQLTAADQMGRFLTQPWVAILLLVIGVIAIGVEFMKPGLTLPGLVGIVSLTLFFLGNVLVGTAGFLELGLALLGIVLLVVEAFIPGFGVFGVAGLISMVAAIFLSVPTTQLAVSYLMWTSIAFVVALAGIIRAVSRRGLGKTLTLERRASGWVPARVDLSGMVGQEGTALTVLRPAGTAKVGDQRLDVVTEGEFIAAGTALKVIRVDGTRVVVRSLAE